MKKLLIILTIVALLMMTFAGCASSNSTEYEDAGYYAQSEVAEAPAAEENMAVDTAKDEAAEPAAGETENASEAGLNYDSSILQPDANRKIIYYGSFQIRTKNFDTDYDNLLATLKALGGYIQDSSMYGSKPVEWNDSGRYATLTLRVPSEKFSEFTSMLGDFGETISRSINGKDVSLDYFDTETKLKTLRTRETRLLELLDQAATLEDIIELENALSDVSYEIQMLETNLRDYDSLIDYSTVTVELEEVNQMEVVTPPDESIGSRISNTFYSVLNVLADFGEFLIVFFVGGAPILIPLAAIAVLVIVLVKRNKKKRQNTPNNLK